MAEPALKFTKADFDLLPEDLRVELIDGEFLKMPFPTVRHQQIVTRLSLRLGKVIGAERFLCGPIGFVVDDWTVLGPDLVAFREGSTPDSDAKDIDRAALVVEVSSPSTASRDRNVKSALYLETGVDEVWLIDGAKRTVDIRTRGGRRLVAAGDTAVSTAIPGFAVKVSNLF